MEPIIVAWWITLIVALIVTVPLLAIVVRFIHHAKEVDRLARVTLAAAAGVAGNTANIVMLDTLLAHATSIAKTSAAIDGVAAHIHGHAGAIVRTLSAGKG